MNYKPRLIEYFKGSLIGLVLATVFWPSLASAVMIDEPFIEAVSMRSDIWTAGISPDGKRLALGFLSDEEKKGKCIPLPWEKKRKIFDKSDIEYRDGDNT